MAIENYASCPTSFPDAVSFKEASALFRETGHPVSARTLARWAREAGILIERFSKTDYVSYSDLLIIHARKVDARER